MPESGCQGKQCHLYRFRRPAGYHDVFIRIRVKLPAVPVVLRNRLPEFGNTAVRRIMRQAFLKSAAGLFNNRLRGNKIRLPDCKTDRICHFLGFVEHLADRRSSEALCKL